MKLILLFLLYSIPIYTQITNIREVDFKNFTYYSQVWDSVTVKNGSWNSFDSVNSKNENLHPGINYFDISIIFGDITKDEQDEAVIIAYSAPRGGSAKYTEGFIFSLIKGKPVQIARLKIGDDCFVDGGGIENVEIRNDKLIVQRCYSISWDIFWKSTSYIWKVNRLIPVKCALINMGYNLSSQEKIKFNGDKIKIEGELKKFTNNKYYRLTTNRDASIKLVGSKNVKIIVGLPDKTVLNKCDKFESSFSFFAEREKEYWIKLYDEKNYRDTTFSLTIYQVK